MDNSRSSDISLNIKYVLWGGASLSALLVIMLGAFALNNLDSSHQDSLRVDHTYEVIIDVHKTRERMVDLVAGQRAFLITGQEEFLTPFQENRANIFKDIANLKTSVSDNPPQVVILESIERQVDDWINTVGSPQIDARQKFDRGEATFNSVAESLINDSGKKQAATINEMFSRFLSMEEILKVQRRQPTLSAHESTEFILIAGFALVVFSTLLVAWVTTRFILNNDWVRSHHSSIVKNLQDATTLEIFSDVLLSTLMPLLTAQTATLYSIHTDTDTDNDTDGEADEIYRIGAYGSIALSNESIAFEKGRGLVGQCFTKRKEIRVTDVPAAYFDIASSLGHATPKEVILLPILFENSTIAVLEMASFASFPGRETVLVHAVAESLGIMINNVIADVRTDTLLQEIKTSEERSSGIIDGSIDAIITISQEGIVLSFNLAGERMFGYSADEVIGENVKMLMPSPYRNEHDDYLVNYRDTGEKKIIGIGREVVARRKDGSLFPMDLSISEIDLQGRKLFGGIIRDITARREAEEKLRQANAELETLLEEIKISEERSSGIINGSIDAIITISQQGIVLSFNLAGERMFGYSADEVIGENVKMLMPSPYRNEHDGYLTNYRDTGEKKIIGIGREVVAKRKDGSLFPMDLSISEIDLQGRKLFGGIIRDITARRETEENLQQANADITARQEAEEKLQQANAELEEFAYRTSHDLRSPIVSSIRLLDIADKSMTRQDHETAKKSLSHAQASLKKLDALLNDILALTAAKSAAEDKQVVDIALMIDEALFKMDHMEGFERLDIQKNISFEGTLSVKQSRLNMILENLISNAIKYQDTSKESSYIAISAYNEDAHFVLEVKDNGLGIPENQQEKLFSMFKRFHPRIAFGSGLGLYLMKKSADVLEGKVSYQRHEHGSIFRLSVPV